MFEPVITKLAGVTFNNSQANIRKWGCADIGTYAVDREPDNAYDPNAVKVSLFGMFPMGYLPKHVAEKLAPLMDVITAQKVSQNHRNKMLPGVNFDIRDHF